MIGNRILPKKEERARVEQKPKGTDEFLKIREAIFDSAEDISFIITDLSSTEPQIVDFSSGAERIFGYDREEIIGKPVALLHRKEDIMKFPREIAAIREGKSGFSGEMTLIRKSGRQFPALFWTYPILNVKSNIIATFGVSIDITKLKRTEEKLRKSEQKFKFLFEESPTINLLVDKEGIITMVNKSVLRRLGYSKNELVGKNLLDIIITEEKEKVAKELKSIIIKNFKNELEINIRAKDESIRTILFSITKLIPDVTQSAEIFIIGIDITRQI